MDPILIFGLLMLTLLALVVLISVIVNNLDRIAVTIMRAFDIRLFPTAIGIAVSITEHPEEWSADKFYMRHPVIGSVWTANAAYGLHVETDMGDWKPSLLERRIIRDAVDWRINQYVKDRLTVAMKRARIAA